MTDEKRSFGTDAVRNSSKGKGRFDLIPPDALKRVAIHYQNGAESYGDHNWRHGIPLSSYMDSAIRHIYCYLEGMRDEDHLAAACWNLLSGMWTEMNIDEMDDISNRPGMNIIQINTLLDKINNLKESEKYHNEGPDPTIPTVKVNEGESNEHCNI